MPCCGKSGRCRKSGSVSAARASFAPRQLLLLAALLAWAQEAPAAGGVLDGKLADSALAEFAAQPDRQAAKRQLDSRLADQALADLPWSPPARAAQKPPSSLAGLQDGLRNVPLNTNRRTASKSTTMRPSADLTSVLANLKNDAAARAGHQPHIVMRQVAITAAPAATAAKPAIAPPKSAPVAAAPAPQPTTAPAPMAQRVAPPPEPQRVTTGVLTGLRLLPPEQQIRRVAPAIAVVAAPAAPKIEPQAKAVTQPEPKISIAEQPPMQAEPASDANIIIEVLPPPSAATTPAAVSAAPVTDQPTAVVEPPSRSSTITDILTSLRLLPTPAPAQPAASPAKSPPPQAFRSNQPPDKMPLFITARSGETVKLAPAPTAPLAGKSLADDALAAYSAVTPPVPSAQNLRFDGLAINLAVSPPDEGKTDERPAKPAAAANADTNQTAKNTDDAALKKKAHEVDAATVPLTGDNTAADVRQELWKEWSEKVILLEQENKALRGELANTKADPLQDIRVDAVAKIKEQVLRERIIELEKEVLEAQNKAREAALNEAAKKAADAALAPPPGLKDIPIKP